MMRPKDLHQGSGTKTFLDAMHGGKVHLARFILDALDGRIINFRTENSRTPLMFAVCLQDSGTRTKFTRLLLEKGANVNCQDGDGRTALSLACEMGHLDVVKLLVQFSADPDVSDAWGNSALMYAAISGHSQVLEFLVRAFKRLGLRLDRTNNAGHSAVEVADFFGHVQCVQILNFPGRRGLGTEDPRDAAGEHRTPSGLPRHVLERLSSSNNEDQLPRVFQKQLKIGDSAGLWNSFRCPRGRCQADKHRHSWALPPQLERSQRSSDHDSLFSTKQLQNCQIRELRWAKTPNSLPELSQKGISRDDGHQDKQPVWGKAKSFNLDLVSSRKQSYQGDTRDPSASKLKRASLQDDRCLTDKTKLRRNSRGLTNEADKVLPKPVSNSKKSQGEDGNDVTPSRMSFALTSRHNQLLFGGMESGTTGTPGIMGLGTRLLRRFTAPDFMRMVKRCSSGSSHVRGRMSRSETFPLSHVDSRPSADSISSVTCEFESCSSPQALD
ncbi:uncharacterized protein LOC117531922 [Thalassophryne amazonica]|uniref:uncharacterized protein LOC117531922 n=1 Tax=Thalassophryne amazonica TaxID=390379 RepID=UPI001471FB25|nr:uncharacterized protein LOC117531922 [Thalassophryne amazonica]